MIQFMFRVHKIVTRKLKRKQCLFLNEKAVVRFFFSFSGKHNSFLDIILINRFSKIMSKLNKIFLLVYDSTQVPTSI